MRADVTVLFVNTKWAFNLFFKYLPLVHIICSQDISIYFLTPFLCLVVFGCKQVNGIFLGIGSREVIKHDNY